MGKRIDIVSDTHGHLSPELRRAIDGCDVLVHAGDITSEQDWHELSCSAPEVHAVEGNNDYFYDYGPQVARTAAFECEGVRFCVAHYFEDVDTAACDVAVCGHTHRARLESAYGCLVVNPGSASYPRGMRGPTIARLQVEGGRVVDAQIVDLR